MYEGKPEGVLEWLDAQLAAEGTMTLDRAELTSPEEAAEVLVPMIGTGDREICIVLTLDTKHRLLHRHIVSIGCLDHTFMVPRDILRPALDDNAGAVIVAHNHPSGDAEPSQDDEVITRRLSRACEAVGVDLLDHLVIAGARWVSLARRGCV